MSDGADRDFGDDATVLSDSNPAPRPKADAPVDQRTEASGGERWEDDGLDRTSHASDLAQLSVVFERRFSAWRSLAEPALSVSLSTPGERTGGGTLGRQQLVIAASDPRRSDRISIGWIDALSCRGAIHTYAEVSTEYGRRFKMPLSASAVEYDELVNEMERFFSARRIVFEPSAPIARGVSQLAPAFAAVPKRDLRFLWVPVAFGLGLLAAYALFQR